LVSIEKNINVDITNDFLTPKIKNYAEQKTIYIRLHPNLYRYLLCGLLPMIRIISFILAIIWYVLICIPLGIVLLILIEIISLTKKLKKWLLFY